VLVDALHVKFPWQSEFAAGADSTAPFTLVDATTRDATFMNQTASLAYVDDGQAQVAALPLFGGELAMVIALPHADIPLASYEAGLANQAALAVPASSALVALSLPKLSFTSASFSLKQALQTLGANLPFDRAHADFLGICENPPDQLNLYVSDVLQKG